MDVSARVGLNGPSTPPTTHLHYHYIGLCVKLLLGGRPALCHDGQVGHPQPTRLDDALRSKRLAPGFAATLRTSGLTDTHLAALVSTDHFTAAPDVRSLVLLVDRCASTDEVDRWCALGSPTDALAALKQGLTASDVQEFARGSAAAPPPGATRAVMNLLRRAQQRGIPLPTLPFWISSGLASLTWPYIDDDALAPWESAIHLHDDVTWERAAWCAASRMTADEAVAAIQDDSWDDGQARIVAAAVL